MTQQKERKIKDSGIGLGFSVGRGGCRRGRGRGSRSGRTPPEKECAFCSLTLAPRLEKSPHTWWIEELLRMPGIEGWFPRKGFCALILAEEPQGSWGIPKDRRLVGESDKIPEEISNCHSESRQKGLGREGQERQYC